MAVFRFMAIDILWSGGILLRLCILLPYQLAYIIKDNLHSRYNQSSETVSASTSAYRLPLTVQSLRSHLQNSIHPSLYPSYPLPHPFYTLRPELMQRTGWLWTHRLLEPQLSKLQRCLGRECRRR